MDGNIILGEIEETLLATPKGGFLLENGVETKALTREEAEAWYEKHFGEKLDYP